MLALLPTLYFHIEPNLLLYLHHMMLVNVKLNVEGRKGSHSKIADFMGLVNFERYNQNSIGNIAIIVL